MERPMRNVDRDFIDNVAPQKLRQPGKAAEQGLLGVMKIIQTVPPFVNKAQIAITPLRFPAQQACKFERPRIRADDYDVAEIASMLPNLPQGAAKQQPAGQHREGIDRPKKHK